jgi:hypothetical protein
MSGHTGSSQAASLIGKPFDSFGRNGFLPVWIFGAPAMK